MPVSIMSLCLHTLVLKFIIRQDSFCHIHLKVLTFQLLIYSEKMIKRIKAKKRQEFHFHSSSIRSKRLQVFYKIGVFKIHKAHRKRPVPEYLCLSPACKLTRKYFPVNLKEFLKRVFYRTSPGDYFFLMRHK